MQFYTGHNLAQDNTTSLTPKGVCVHAPPHPLIPLKALLIRNTRTYTASKIVHTVRQNLTPQRANIHTHTQTVNMAEAGDCSLFVCPSPSLSHSQSMVTTSG